MGPKKGNTRATNYTGLADLMAANPEKAIVHRSIHLNIKNPLYLQAELACLEEGNGENEGYGENRDIGG